MVRLHRFTAACALLVTAGTVPTAAHAATANTGPATLYVNNSSSHCADSGTGTSAVPFCTIQAAANVAIAGQTVLIGGWGTYAGATVTRSGSASAPITFAAQDTYFYANSFTINGASNIVVDGLFATTGTGDSLLVSHASNITVKDAYLRDFASSATTAADAHVTGASTNVTLEQSRLDAVSGVGGGVLVDGGASGTVVTTNYLSNFAVDGIAVSGASGTDITSNTLSNICSPGISVSGTSTGTVVENNSVSGVPSPFGGCSSSDAYVLDVAADSTSSTTANYNVLSNENGKSVPYFWAGVAYTSTATFQAQTGQGSQDAVVASLGMSTSSIPTTSPLYGTANSAAPGELATDLYGRARENGRYDRGAFELAEYTGATLAVWLMRPQYIQITANVRGVTWGSSVREAYSWGDGTSDSFTDNPDLTADFRDFYGASHTYHFPGTYTITETLTDGVQTTSRTTTVTTSGDTFVPVSPRRILDTRTGLGTGGVKAAVPANSAIAVSVSSGVPGAPAASTIDAVVMDVIATASTSSGTVTVYPDGTAVPSVTNIGYTGAAPVANLVTVKVAADGKVDLYNRSTGTTQLVADVEGYYVTSSSGDGYVPMASTRLLDTRTGTGAPAGAVAPNGTVNLKIEGNASIPASGVAAVALNVTAAQGASSGHITVYPGGAPLPVASVLDFAPGQSVAGLAVVPVGPDGTVNLTNSSSGTTQVAADVAGYFTAGHGDAFVPIKPVRILDTRSGLGEESAPHHLASQQSQMLFGISDIATAPGSSYVMNTVALNATAAGTVVVYPSSGSVPTTANLYFTPGQTTRNLVMVEGPNVDVYNNSAQAIDVVVDLFGYFS